MNKPKISIITINFNNVKGLDKTISSVVNQTFNDFEYVVIDGGSTDGSDEIIKKNSSKINYWVSEKDKGIYNAMNKGIVKATGEYILFLNSGDYFVDNVVLENISKELNGVEFVSGNLEYYLSDNSLFTRVHPDKLTFSYLITKTISHPSTFIKREMFEKFGLYNETLKIVSDWEFFFKCLGLNGATYKSIDMTVTHFDMFGVSSSNGDEVKAEKEFVLEKYLPTIFNNEMDSYIFNKFKEKDKRFKLLKKIEKNSFVRKGITVILAILAKLAK